MANAPEAIDLLRSIDNSLKALIAAVQPLLMQVRAAQPKPVASDRDLDGRYGDPVLKFTPRDWTGAPFKGRPFSECPPDLLDLVAQTFDYFATQAEQKNERANNGKPVADYKRADAARARGWARRIRDGRHVQRTAVATTGAPSGWSEDSDSDGWGEVQH